VSNELSKQKQIELDGFDSYDDSVEGPDRPPSNQGSILKFTNEARWVTREGEEIPPTKELIAIGIGREVVKWNTNKDEPPARTILEPGQRFPDIEKFNAETPQSEWIETPDGRMRGPYEAHHVVYLLDPVTMSRYRYPTGTVGGHIAVSELVDQTKWMRRIRGANVYAVLVLTDVFMKTRWGGRQRPHLRPVRWITFGDGGDLPVVRPPKLVSPCIAATLDQFAEQSQQTSPEKPQTGMQTVEPPNLKEEIDDHIPF
jgi:hypothetical protein